MNDVNDSRLLSSLHAALLLDIWTVLGVEPSPLVSRACSCDMTAVASSPPVTTLSTLGSLKLGNNWLHRVHMLCEVSDLFFSGSHDPYHVNVSGDECMTFAS